MAKGFSLNGYQVTLLGMNSVSSSKSYVDESNQSSLYPVVIPYTENPPSRSENFDKWNRMRGEAIGYMRRFFEELDLSDTILITLHVYVMEHLIETGVKLEGEDGLAVIGMYHNSFDSCRDIGDLKRVKRSYSHARRFLALTQADRDKYAAAGMTNASFMYNPVELLTTPRVLPPEEREKRVVYVGRFAREKRVPELVRIWASISDQCPGWRFDIYGVGPEENEIAKTILECGVTESVTICGKTQNPEQVLADARLMVMASDFEGLPVVIVEAGLVGTPTLATECSPGMAVLISSGETGELVKDRDYQSMAIRLRDLLQNPELVSAYSRNAEMRMQEFGIANIADQWESLFAKLELI
ncbi:glycosyltransferase [Corynebacterium pseudogenitalium]|uniref:glycosyltransferase n=1 Tax=Corynebacterium pseudogenitalium TaxID=38303 RepID=UPI003BA301DD